MKVARLNSIAARIAVTIVAAITLGIALDIAVAVSISYIRDGSAHVIYSRNNIGVINPPRNAPIVSGRIVTIVHALASAPEAEKAGIIAYLTEPDMHIALRATPLDNVDERDDGRLSFLRQLIQLQLGEPLPALRVSVPRPPVNGDGTVDLAHTSSTSAAALVEIALPDGRWVAITLPDFLDPVRLIAWPLFLGPLFVLAALLSVWTARRLAAPIRDFAHAAERLGVDMTAPPLAERGPHELRTAIRAFNLMQERLRRFLDDRTQMLAAISHDLRAPLARLRLRAELVEDDEQQRKMFGDLAMMNAMIDSTLAFARDDARQEPRRLVDLGVLVADVCEDMADVGGSVAYLGPRGIDVTCRPSAIRRAVTNLVDNAVKYAGSARVHIICECERVAIVVDDEGPGIAAEEREKVFAPFYRLDPSRDPDKAGVGLGLSVARTIAREHGGDIALVDGDNGGLRARLELPA
jgi:signal transduction histidine kinase